MILPIYIVSEKWAESECFYTQFFTFLELVFSMKYHGNAYYAYSSTGQRYIDSLNWKLESWSSMISRVEFRELSFGGLSTYFWPALQISLKTSKPKETETCIFKSSLFISLIKCPIVSFFNYKLLTRLSCPLLPLSGSQLALSGLQN